MEIIKLAKKINQRNFSLIEKSSTFACFFENRKINFIKYKNKVLCQK
jgi:hypothetical protein